MIDERTDLPEGTEVELQLVEVTDAFTDMAPEDRDELEEAIEEGFRDLKTATTSAHENSWHSREPRTLEGRDQDTGPSATLGKKPNCYKCAARADAGQGRDQRGSRTRRGGGASLRKVRRGAGSTDGVSRRSSRQRA